MPENDAKIERSRKDRFLKCFLVSRTIHFAKKRRFLPLRKEAAFVVFFRKDGMRADNPCSLQTARRSFL